MLRVAAGGSGASRRIIAPGRSRSDADRFRKSGAVTWVEEARPLAPTEAPAEALAALAAAGAETGNIAKMLPA